MLTRLLAEKLERYEIVALSGTSGGAICALLVWYALLRNDRREAVRLLDSFCESVSACSPKERVMNDQSVEANRMQGSVATPLVTPYLYPEWGREALKELLDGVADFGEIRRLVTGSSPKLLLSAVEVRSGEFEVFRDAEVTAEKILRREFVGSAQKSTEPAAEETQKSTEVAAQDAQETQKSTEIAAEDAEKNTDTAAFPIDGYDEMNVGEVSERLDGLSADELKRVRKYEKRNKERGSLRKEMKQKIETTS